MQDYKIISSSRINCPHLGPGNYIDVTWKELGGIRYVNLDLKVPNSKHTYSVWARFGREGVLNFIKDELFGGGGGKHHAEVMVDAFANPKKLEHKKEGIRVYTKFAPEIISFFRSQGVERLSGLTHPAFFKFLQRVYDKKELSVKRSYFRQGLYKLRILQRKTPLKVTLKIRPLKK